MKQMKRSAFLGTTLSLGALAPATGRAAAPSARRENRDDVKRIIAANRKIVSPNGIEELLSVEVNGCVQWILIRGRDRRNPVLLYLHGGPGSPTMPESWTFQSPWEDFFTVVQWDQRGAGKTFASNDPAAIAPTMTATQMISDAEYVIQYLLERLRKKKLFALGHSWGSYLGLEVARQHPEWLHAYVGTGQMVDTQRSEAEGYTFALQQTRVHRNNRALHELQALTPYPGPIGALSVERISAQRKWLIYYGGLTYGRTSFDYDADAWQLAPEYTGRDIRLVDKGSLFSLGHLIGVVQRVNFEALTHVGCPLFIFQGKHDRETSYAIAKRWYDRLEAPRKRFVTFANSAHMAMLEQPGQYLDCLVRLVRPTAAL
jgi:pimeloyl-ACP methyl ester carboxylesterase